MTRPARPSPTWWVGVLAFVILAYILVNNLRTEGPGSRGLDPGANVPAFAAPLVLSGLEGDANLATAGNLGDAGPVPACEVQGDDVLNGCDLVRDRPAVIGFFFNRGADCEGGFDLLQELADRRPDVNVAGVMLGDRDELRETVRENGWTFPIAHDNDRALSTVFGVLVCPEYVLTVPPGKVQATLIGADVDLEAELEEGVRPLSEGG